MARDIDVSIVLPCYNEKENLEVLLPEIIGKFSAKGVEFEILVVDDSSPDGTPEFVEDFSCNDSRVKLVLREKKEGIGAQYANAFINREKLIEEMQRSGIMGTELDQLPDRYRTAALLRLQLKELSARKRERSKALRDEKRRRIGVQ